MHEKVEKYLNKKKQVLEKEKEKFLISQGLYERKFSPEDKPSPEFSQEIWDTKSQKMRYYKNEAIKITDEEYQEIVDVYTAARIKAPKKETSNNIGTALRIIGMLFYLAGFIAGIVGGIEGADYRDEFAVGIALIYWGISAIGGTVLLGFSEIIKILHCIKEKLQ